MRAGAQEVKVFSGEENVQFSSPRVHVMFVSPCIFKQAEDNLSVRGLGEFFFCRYLSTPDGWMKVQQHPRSITGQKRKVERKGVGNVILPRGIGQVEGGICSTQASRVCNGQLKVFLKIGIYRIASPQAFRQMGGGRVSW